MYGQANGLPNKKSAPALGNKHSYQSIQMTEGFVTYMSVIRVYTLNAVIRRTIAGDLLVSAKGKLSEIVLCIRKYRIAMATAGCH